MNHLYLLLAERTREWRESDYVCEQFPAISEILQFQRLDDAGQNLRFLRPPQFKALEVYWYLRLVEKTPHILELYKASYPKKADLIKALGIPQKAFEVDDYDLEPLLERIATDDQFVKDFKRVTKYRFGLRTSSARPSSNASTWTRRSSRPKSATGAARWIA